MERGRKQAIRREQKVSLGLLLLAALHITMPALASAQDSGTSSAPEEPALGYLTLPANVTAAVGNPAVFKCGVPGGSANVTFTFSGSHGNYSLICPGGHVEDIPQALYGSCETKGGESLAVWALKGTSLSDNGTRVVCHKAGNTDAPTAFLHVYDNGVSYATLVGCLIGAFFGTLLVAALLFVTLQRSESVRKCFGGTDVEDDLDTIVTKDHSG